MYIDQTQDLHNVLCTCVCPYYITQAERRDRTETEVDGFICWLTEYGQQELETQIEIEIDFEIFFAEGSQLNPARTLIKDVICGVRVEYIEELIMQEIRYLDKLIDELANGKSMDKILRK